MPTAIDVRANENAEYTNTVISKAADIIEDMAAGNQAWTAVTALEQADRGVRSQNDHGELHFTIRAVVNSIDRHLAAAEEEHNNQPHWTLRILSGISEGICNTMVQSGGEFLYIGVGGR